MESPFSNLSAVKESQINFVMPFKPNSEQGKQYVDVCWPYYYSFSGTPQSTS